MSAKRRSCFAVNAGSSVKLKGNNKIASFTSTLVCQLPASDDHKPEIAYMATHEMPQSHHLSRSQFLGCTFHNAVTPKPAMPADSRLRDKRKPTNITKTKNSAISVLLSFLIINELA